MKKRTSARPKMPSSRRPKTRVLPRSKTRASAATAAGADAAWSSSAATTLWHTAATWSPATVPTGAATFGASNQTGITFAGGSVASVDAIEFEGGAAAYTLTFTEKSPAAPTLTIRGAGISNLSSNAQLVSVAAFSASRDNPQLAFSNAATAGGAGMRYKAGPTDPSGQGGGVIRFYDTSTAGSASFEVTTGSGTPPRNGSTVGAEVTFSETASADAANFTVYGSTSTTDGDTFGNVVFHDMATAAQATFTNIGGTVAHGDGGNTQFYDSATAGQGHFHNLGASIANGNGGDVAFDGTATAADGHFHNHAAAASGGYGGVTSFNNNCPAMPSTQGSSAGSAHFHNYGATGDGQYGGHVYFTAKYGSPTAANGTFINHGASVAGTSANAGRTVFSISVPQQAGQTYTPSGGNAVFVNLPGTCAGAPGGVTEFTVFSEPTSPCAAAATPPSGRGSREVKGAKPGTAVASNSIGPTAAAATIISLGGRTPGANGGQTLFSGVSGVVVSAGNAQLVALGGTNGGQGGTIVFHAGSSGGSATVGLSGNGTLDVSQAGQAITLGAMNLSGGIVACVLGTQPTGVNVTGSVSVWAPVAFDFSEGTGFVTGKPYTVLTAPNLSSVSAGLFSGNNIGQATPSFALAGNSLQVTFNSAGTVKVRRPRSRTQSPRRVENRSQRRS
jgi:hypothetical protein